jgi:lipopolysaccharide/colanic/teichoic acid biosynthesis glycosyltransferase
MSSQAYFRSSKIFKNFQSSNTAPPGGVWTGIAKRAFDIVMSLLGLIFLAPLFAYIAYIIGRDSPGPAFFWGSRMGRNGKPFKMLKFRTMFERADSYQGPMIASHHWDIGCGIRKLMNYPNFGTS